MDTITLNQSIPDKLSIFDYPTFPSKTKPFQFTPAQVLSCLVDYESTNMGIKKTCENFGIGWSAFWDALQVYPEISTRYALARTRKAEIYDQAGDATLDIPTPQEAPHLYQTDREGHRVLTSAAVRLLELRRTHYEARALQAETGTRVQRTQTESKNLNLTIHAAPDELPALASIISGNDPRA